HTRHDRRAHPEHSRHHLGAHPRHSRHHGGACIHLQRRRGRGARVPRQHTEAAGRSPARPSRAWAAFRAPTPAGLGAIAATRSPDLRFLGEAFDRLGREYPAVRDGLSLTERRILAAVANGPVEADTAFARAASRETRPYLGDTTCFAIMERLARAPVPVLETDPA